LGVEENNVKCLQSEKRDLAARIADIFFNEDQKDNRNVSGCGPLFEQIDGILDDLPDDFKLADEILGQLKGNCAAFKAFLTMWFIHCDFKEGPWAYDLLSVLKEGALKVDDVTIPYEVMGAEHSRRFSKRGVFVLPWLPYRLYNMWWSGNFKLSDVNKLFGKERTELTQNLLNFIKNILENSCANGIEALQRLFYSMINGSPYDIQRKDIDRYLNGRTIQQTLVEPICHIKLFSERAIATWNGIEKTLHLGLGIIPGPCFAGDVCILDIVKLALTMVLMESDEVKRMMHVNELWGLLANYANETRIIEFLCPNLQQD
jgi:hypothetical protein